VSAVHDARWDGPPLSTSSSLAADRYLAGIAALVSGTGHADRLLTAALDADPGFVLAAVGRAVSRVVDGGAYEAVVVAPGTTSRGERQHVEIVHAQLSGDRARANDLRREHLLEFPGDLLVVWLPAASRTDRAAPT
jgi:hypothetical protein